MSRLIKSSLGSFVSRVGLGITEIVGIIYVADVAGASTLGTYALFVAVYVLALLLSSLGIWEATVKRIAEGKLQGEFLVAEFLIRLALSLPIVLVLVLFRDTVSAYIGSPVAVPYLIVTLFAVMFAETISSGLHGEQRVGRAEFTLFLSGVTKLVCWVVFLWQGYGAAGLFAGLVLSKVVYIVVGAQFLTIRPRRPTREQFASLFEFSRYSWMSTVRNQAWLWTDTIVLGFFVASELIGVYELTWRISAAFFLVSSALSATLYANVDRMIRNDGLDSVKRAVNESLVYSGIMAIPGVVGGLVVARSLLLALGQQYTVGYWVFVILIFARLAHSYEEIFAKVINAFDRPDLMFRANVIYVVLNLVGNVVAIAAVGWVGAAIATAASMAIRTALSYRYLRSLVDITIPKREILSEVCAAILMGIALFWFTRGGTLSFVETVSAVVGGAAIYAILVLVFIGRVRTRVKSLVATVI
ncbi:lipopolysaccharide biosynthesis protein [Halogranum rubrum]|uniref:Uncharacterized protein n=1 Tax=Halogranum salarium B-1 TaxID=1210908 RepID=J2Z8W7_9EURY|nr:lipopolysaccharide biosynthesis protein [Halogranum salarium]EJN57075.1 hypothetical protein HSB1_44610 [Halogranum salarium B-1]